MKCEVWQIQARLKTGTEWEPLSLDPRDGNGERKYHYDAPAECQAALDRYHASEHSFPALIAKLAAGSTFLEDDYELRFVQIGLESAIRALRFAQAYKNV